MEKHFEGTLPFQAGNVADLKAKFGLEDSGSDSESWDPDAWPETLSKSTIFLENTNCICKTHSYLQFTYKEIFVLN